ncbi:MAG: hypothetical protein IPL27_06470 [Lewinellaceae bacterium]|nr:hypothetical protein [Lewinellaceae bacterium]
MMPTQFRLQTGSAGAGNVTVTISDDDNDGCTLDVPVDDPGVCSFACPTLSGGTFTGFVCAGGNFSLSVTQLTNMAQAANSETDFGLTFVAFSGAVDPYTAGGGTVLGTLTFAMLGDGGTTATLNVMNTNLPVGNYVAYAILSPTPAVMSCRPSFQYMFQVVASPTVFNVTGGGSTCENNGPGFPIGLSPAPKRIFLCFDPQRDGFRRSLRLSGTGMALDFGDFSTAGTYTVVATDNTGANRTANMSGNAIISAQPESPVPTVTTPVLYCQGDMAVPLTAGGVNLLWYEQAIRRAIFRSADAIDRSGR